MQFNAQKITHCCWLFLVSLGSFFHLIIYLQQNITILDKLSSKYTSYINTDFPINIFHMYLLAKRLLFCDKKPQHLLSRKVCLNYLFLFSVRRGGECKHSFEATQQRGGHNIVTATEVQPSYKKFSYTQCFFSHGAYIYFSLLFITLNYICISDVVLPGNYISAL